MRLSLYTCIPYHMVCSNTIPVVVILMYTYIYIYATYKSRHVMPHMMLIYT